MIVFRVKWSRSAFAMNVLAHDEDEAHRVAREDNDKRPSDRSFGEIESVEPIVSKPAVIGYGL